MSYTPQETPKNPAPLELLLSILVAISLGFAIERLVNLDDTLVWLFFSLLAVLIAVSFICTMVDLPKLTFKDLSRICVLVAVIFFPFTLARLNEGIAKKSTGFIWGNFQEMLYGLSIGVFFILWGYSELKENKTKGWAIIVLGLVIVLASLALWVLFGRSNL